MLRILRERIARYELSPGAKLNELELAKEFHVPRTRVRDAFLALEQRGLIERIPNRGAMVARLEADLLVCTHSHRDHADPVTLAAVAGAGKVRRFLGPAETQ